MKKTALLFLATLTLSGHALAQQASESLGNLITEVWKASNLVKYEDMKVANLDGWISKIETLTENGQKYYVLTIGSQKNKNDVYSKVVSVSMLCVVDKATAASMEYGKKVSFTAFIKAVEPYKQPGQSTTFKRIVAACNFD